MYYIVQNNLFTEQNYNNLISTLEKSGVEFEIVKVLPFIDTIEMKTNRKDIFAFGALKMAEMSKFYGWNPGVLMTENHNYLIYKDYYKNNLLNYDSKIVKLMEDFKWDIDQYFIRPTEDSKSFTGKVFDKQEWKEYRNYLLTNGHRFAPTVDTDIQVSIPKKIYREIRFFIVGGKVVTGSQYRLGGKLSLNMINAVIDSDAIKFCEEMINIFQLASSFVMDVCLTENGWKIVECGCINCAGFYASDMQKLVNTIDNYYK
jgi:hypothetical protein